MAHYAILDENNFVIDIFVGVDETETIEGKTTEQWYSDFAQKRVLRTSRNTFQNQHSDNKEPFRGNYAGIGYFYNKDLDAFIPPKPNESWNLDTNIFDWVAPTPRPEGEGWIWDEENQRWFELNLGGEV